MVNTSEVSELRAALLAAEEKIAKLEAERHGELLVDVQVAQALQSSRVGLWAWDIESNSVQWSDGVSRLFGMGPGEFDGSYEAYLALLPAGDREIVQEAISRTLESGTEYQVEHGILTKNAKSLWLQCRAHLFRSEQGAPKRLVGVVADITERRQAELRLEESEKRFVVFAEASTEGVVISVDGTIVDANRTACRVFGYGLGELVGTADSDLVDPKDEELVRSMVRSNTKETYRHRARAKDGRLLIVEARGRESTYRGGRARLTTIRDVTAEMRLAAEREALEAQLRHAQKMEAVGQLAGGIAHDFNNILTIILANVDMALKRLQGTEREKLVCPLLDEVERATLRAQALTIQLLAFGRRQPNCPKPVDLGEMLEGMRSMLVPLIRENIELRIEGGSKLAAVKLDPGQLQQVVMNLVVNARDSMPLGGRLTLRTENQTAPGEGLGDRVLLRVTDTGVGMSSTVLARAFEPFFTTKPVGQGTGLGLSMVDGIVQQAGGSVTATSKLGQGSCIELAFPSVAYSEGTTDHVVANHVVANEQEQTGTETVLICEDEGAIRELLTHLLSAAGYEVFSADCGATALSAANDIPSLDLLLTDVVMPGLNGKSLANQLLVIHPEAKVLFCSGYADDVLTQQGVLDAGLSFLPKPFSPPELLTRVRLVLDATEANPL